MDKPTSRQWKTEISNNIFNEEGGERNKWGSRDVNEPGEFGKRPSERYQTFSDIDHDEEDLSRRDYEAHETSTTLAEPQRKKSNAASSGTKPLVKDTIVTPEEVPAAGTTYHQCSVRKMNEDSGRPNLPEERYADPVPDPRRRGAIWFGYPSGQGPYEASRVDEEFLSEATRQ
jgi:hypothetical protein